MDTANTFSDFLKVVPSQKEVSLVIAKDQVELQTLRKMLDQNGYTQIVDRPEFLKYVSSPSKTYFLVQENLPKRIYDFVLQYPSGQIEVFDKDKMESTIINPVYKDVSVLILVTKDALAKIQQTGFQVLENTGMAYQS